jgi:hypothetical protein
MFCETIAVTRGRSVLDRTWSELVAVALWVARNAGEHSDDASEGTRGAGELRYSWSGGVSTTLLWQDGEIEVVMPLHAPDRPGGGRGRGSHASRACLPRRCRRLQTIGPVRVSSIAERASAAAGGKDLLASGRI